MKVNPMTCWKVKTMGGTANALLYTSIGEVIKRYREQASLTLTQLGNLSGIHKGVLSKIENGETKRPELKTIRAISRVLNIPFAEIIEYYMEVEHRTEVLRELLMEAVSFLNISLVRKVAAKFLQSPHEDSMTTLEQLYQIAAAVSPVEMRIELYDVIIHYARRHGIQHFLAKGLLQKYLIDRMDLKKLDESFRSGEEIIHYVDFLPHEDKISFYFKMALHAHNIKKYEKCIEYALAGFAEDTTVSELKERVALAVCNCFILLGDFDSAEKYLLHFERLRYNFITERAKAIRAHLFFGKQDYLAAIPLLRECLSEATDDTRLHLVNDLVESLIHSNQLPAVQEVFDSEEKRLRFAVNTPHKHRELGRYFQLKGDWLMKTGKPDEGIEYYLQSMFAYEHVRAYEEINQCVGAIFTYHVNQKLPIKKEIIEKLEDYYKIMNRSYKRKRGKDA